MKLHLYDLTVAIRIFKNIHVIVQNFTKLYIPVRRE